MQATPRKLRAVFRNDVRLVVPLFQRPYVWEADTQWRPLWEDVLETREALGADSAPHFLGAVVLEDKPVTHGSLEVREVIDGQQRLTTLQLLIAAVRDTFRERHPQHRLVKRLDRMVANDPDLVDAPEERHKLWPTNRDRTAFREVMLGEHRDQRFDQKLPRIVGAYAWFRDALHAHLSGVSDDQAELEAIAEVLFEHLEVVVIDLDAHDNAQVIFETLNARGTPLRASDLIKNLVFRTLQEDGRQVEALYNKHWEALESDDWQRDVRQGRLVRPRLDAFMGFFLVVHLQREVQAHRLFPAARGDINGNPDRALNLLEEASRYAQVYDRLERLACDSEEEQASLSRMRIVDTATMTPLLLWLLRHTHGSERLTCLETLESYVVRRSLCRLTTKNYNRTFLELLRRLGSGERPADRVIRDFLLSQRSDSGLWPGDVEVRRSLATLPIYRLLKQERLQRLLLALEAHASTARTEALPTSKRLSVEHLMPQRWNENWPLPDDRAAADEESNRRGELLHVLGNLTIVTGRLNSALSNGSWRDKRAALLAHSALTLNRSLPEVWTTDTITARGSFLSGMACSLWSRPESETADLLVADGDRDLSPDRDAALDSGASTSSTSGRSKGPLRRDIARHIDHAFSDLAIGAFLSISEIQRKPSPEYAPDVPSAGAINARLFPANGRVTLQGVEPAIREGVRGAIKTVSN